MALPERSIFPGQDIRNGIIQRFDDGEIVGVKEVRRALKILPGDPGLTKIREHQKEVAYLSQLAHINSKLMSGHDTHRGIDVPLSDRKKGRLVRDKENLRYRIARLHYFSNEVFRPITSR